MMTACMDRSEPACQHTSEADASWVREISEFEHSRNLWLQQIHPGDATRMMLQIQCSTQSHHSHLRKDIVERDDLHVEVSHSLHLLRVKVLHFLWCDHAVAIQINHSEPVCKRHHIRLVLL